MFWAISYGQHGSTLLDRAYLHIVDVGIIYRITMVSFMLEDLKQLLDRHIF